MQQSLKEKEAHIVQLLKERDFERAEFTRAAQKFEQVRFFNSLFPRADP